MTKAEVEEQTLQILSEVTSDESVRSQPDLPLYESGLLDSLGTVNLILALGDAFGLTVSPAEFDPKAWATPRKLVADVQRRLAENQAVGA